MRALWDFVFRELGVQGLGFSVEGHGVSKVLGFRGYGLLGFNIRVRIIRIGFCGTLSYIYNKEPPNRPLFGVGAVGSSTSGPGGSTLRYKTKRVPSLQNCLHGGTSLFRSVQGLERQRL